MKLLSAMDEPSCNRIASSLTNLLIIINTQSHGRERGNSMELKPSLSCHPLKTPAHKWILAMGFPGMKELTGQASNALHADALQKPPHKWSIALHRNETPMSTGKRGGSLKCTSNLQIRLTSRQGASRVHHQANQATNTQNSSSTC